MGKNIYWINKLEKVNGSVIKKTFESKGYITSKYALTYAEALEAGLKFLGSEYKEIGKPGTGIFRSIDGLRQFRIDKHSISGKHSPNMPHFHLEILEKHFMYLRLINQILILKKQKNLIENQIIAN